MKTANESSSRALTQSQTVRLECLRLVFNPTKDANYLIAKAMEFENYVENGKQEGVEVWVLNRDSTKPDGQGEPNAPV